MGHSMPGWLKDCRLRVRDNRSLLQSIASWLPQDGSKGQPTQRRQDFWRALDHLDAGLGSVAARRVCGSPLCEPRELRGPQRPHKQDGPKA